MLVDLHVLKESHPQLWRRVVGIYNRQDTGEIDLDSLKPEVAQQLCEWCVAQVAAKQPEEFRIDPAEAERRATERQREADEQAGLARLQQYADEQGLEPTAENAEAVKMWLDANLKGYWSRAGVDAAIQNLGPKGRNVLRFKPRTPATPPAQPTGPAETSEQLESWQLPINATEAQMRRASLDAVKDLAKRRRAASQHSRQGWHGTRFV